LAVSEYHKAYYLAHRDEIIARAKARYEAKKADVRAYKKRWQQANKAEIAAKKKVYHETNKDEISAYHKARYAADPDAVKARTKAYRQANPEKVKAAIAAWCDANREHYRSIKRAYAKRRPDVGRKKQAERRARLASAFVEVVDYKDVLRAANGRCGICSGPLGDSVHFDHIVPLARGGKHQRSNIQAAHPRCNLRKGAKSLSEVQAWL
jgi:5-methylcytosine-specific restriction endonuclease McrA